MSTQAERVLILMYHIVDHPQDPSEARLCCTPDRFEKQMRHLVASDATLMDLESLSDCLDGTRAWPLRGVIVTLDDGFRCAYEHALRILEANRIPATVFVVADRLSKTNNWAHYSSVHRRGLLGRDELREMSDRGLSVGSHTLTHPRLPELAPDELSRELTESRKVLEDLLGRPVTQFAYPYGQFSEAVQDATELAGYRAACSTRSGFNRPGTDRFALRRVEVYGHDTLRMFRQKLMFGMNEASLLFPLRYYRDRILSHLGLGRRGV